MKWEWIVTFSRYTESWRLSRKLLDRSLRPAVVAAYRPLLQTKAHVLLTQVLANPVNFEAHLYQSVTFLSRRKLSSLSGSQILVMEYDHEVKEPNVRKVNAARELMQFQLKQPSHVPLVNYLPFCGCSRRWTSSTLSTIHPRVTLLVELQAACSLWLCTSPAPSSHARELQKGRRTYRCQYPGTMLNKFSIYVVASALQKGVRSTCEHLLQSARDPPPLQYVGHTLTRISDSR
jgi:hypothetical protein